MVVSSVLKLFEVGDCIRVNFVGAFVNARINAFDEGNDCEPVVFPGFFVVVDLQEVADGSC